MTDKNTDNFAQQLQQMRSQVLEQIRTQRGGQLGRADAAEDRHDVQSSDWAQVDGERDLAMAIDERETAELEAIEAAFERIEAGTYGECSACGVDIPVARLHANPVALRCIACQEQVERVLGENHPSL